jgi:TolA-binding protein
MIQMSEETTASRMGTPQVSEPPTSHNELSALRKEIVEARNLIIKTDNLLKNLHAELKQMGRAHDEQEKRHWMTSVTAYVAFAVLAGVGAIAYARAEVRTAREEAQGAEIHARALQLDGEKIKTADLSRRDASDKAARIYDMLGSEKEGPGLNQAMSQALHLERNLLSPLESKAIDDRAAGMKARMAQSALERGNSAFRRQDWQNTSVELGRYIELDGKSADPAVWYHLGQSRVQIKDFAGAVLPLETYLKTAGTGKVAQYAGFLLGQSYEETGNAAKAREVFERAEKLYPGSEFAPAIRNHLRRVQAQVPSGTPPPAPAKP